MFAKRVVPTALRRPAAALLGLSATLLTDTATKSTCMLPAAHHVSQRYCSSTPSAATTTTSSAPGSAFQSAVNVEEFTLNQEVVKQDMEMLARWNALSEELDAARTAADYDALLSHVQTGLQLLEEVGALNAPIQCECLLCMEASQAHFNGGAYDDALRYADRARESLVRDCKPELQDRAQIAEIETFMGFTLCRQGEGAEAQALLEKVLHWVNVDAKSAMPMQAVAAVNLRRSVLSGIGQAMTLRGRAMEEKGETAEAKELYAKALDTLIEGLNQHIDENDFAMVKSTLRSILACFEGLGDVTQAVTTCRKYVSWCRRHKDEAGIAEGEAMMSELCARHKIENPLEAEKAETEKSAAEPKKE